MTRYKYIILGAGPSGLSFAHALKQAGEESFLVIEKEDVAGGLCRSEAVDGAPLDIGGGHFLDVKRREVLDFLFHFMPHDEWEEYSRISRINIQGVQVDYPLEANLWQFPIPNQIDFIESIANAGCVTGTPMPESFQDWVYWKLGERIAEEYMLPYNRKIWSVPLEELGTYWLYKLPDVSFRDTLQSCLERRPAGALPAHGTFLYPKNHGYGEVWKRMGDRLGDKLLVSTPVTTIDLANRVINGEFEAEKIVTTIPWTAWLKAADLQDRIRTLISRLEYVSIDVDYQPENLPTPSHWIYEPRESLPFHRILCRSNFCKGSHGYWTETNSRRAVEATGWRNRNEFAYPLNTHTKPSDIGEICQWAEENSIISLGRWGTWEHMNSDVAVSMGIAAAKKITEVPRR